MNLFRVMMKDLRLLSRDRSALVFLLLVPMVVIFVIAETHSESGSKSILFPIVNEDQGPVANALIKVFRELAARHRGEVSAEVTLAQTPSETHLSAITDALRAVTGKDVQVDVKVEPAILGGLVVKLGSRMVDSSLRTRLNAIKQAMKEVS